MKRYTVGVDFGTLSGRALLLDAVSGKIVASSTLAYEHGVMDRCLPTGKELRPHFALQHPLDYLKVLHHTIPDILKQAGVSPEEVAGMCLDFTSCTLLPISKDGTPLCCMQKYENEPHAYVKLWKHHAAQPEADMINRIASERGEDWLRNYGGKISCEWALPKILETLRHAPDVFADTARFLEAGDWLSFVLTEAESSAASFAGLKFLWDADKGFPSNDFFSAIDQCLSGLVGSKMIEKVHQSGDTAGLLSKKGAELTGLPVGTPLAVPMVDAMSAMPALNITKPGTVMLILGTSGVQLIHAKDKAAVPGICGFVRHGVIPGLYTYEAGQAGLGDSFQWFIQNCVPESYTAEARQKCISIHQYLREKASDLRVGESGLLALDWLNGNRSTLQDMDLSGLLLGLTIRTRPEEIYRALLESTAFGMRRILESFSDNGLPTDRIFATGGIAKKDALMMQIYADVSGRHIYVADTENGGAHGAAIYAAVAAGLYPSIQEAADKLSVKNFTVYRPVAENTAAYDRLYAEYCRLYDYFGRGENPVMKFLRNNMQGIK